MSVQWKDLGAHLGDGLTSKRNYTDDSTQGAVVSEDVGPLLGSRTAQRYAVRQVLGHGGMGTVYRVVDEATDTEVALKRLVGRAASSRTAQRLFEREYHTLALLKHPSVIKVYDYGVDDNGPWYTMELLEGQDAESLAPMTWRACCGLLRDVASSLALLHSRGLIHRDVSPRNVRCTADGRAKLIDFGAMVHFGVTTHLVGTAPFVSPESFHLQSLDGRADLYSLGSLAYRLLTAHHAYPVSRMEELLDAWKTAPLPVSTVVPNVPDALNELVMSLPSLDARCRPGSAAEVVDRLAGIAGLPVTEDLGVRQAYLTTPTLVGRDDQLQLFREQLLGAARMEAVGSGGCVLVQGERGTGRTRFLDACVLEARLAGALVSRVGANAGARDFAVAERLFEQLSAQLPSAGGPLADAADLEGFRTGSAESCAGVHEDLSRWVLQAADKRPLVIAVDDYDRVDGPTAALLATLAGQARKHRLVLVVTGPSRAPATPAWNVLAEAARRSELPRLGRVETGALVGSVFGGAPNSELLADRVHTIAEGIPRAVMELCQHLVDTGVVRYAAGHWLIPDRLEGTWPDSTTEVLVQSPTQ